MPNTWPRGISLFSIGIERNVAHGPSLCARSRKSCPRPWFSESFTRFIVDLDVGIVSRLPVAPIAGAGFIARAVILFRPKSGIGFVIHYFLPSQLLIAYLFLS